MRAGRARRPGSRVVSVALQLEDTGAWPAPSPRAARRRRAGSVPKRFAPCFSQKRPATLSQPAVGLEPRLALLPPLLHRRRGRPRRPGRRSPAPRAAAATASGIALRAHLMVPRSSGPRVREKPAEVGYPRVRRRLSEHVADATQRELSYRKRLIEIANHDQLRRRASRTILVDIKDKMLDLVDAERVTIFALDTKNQELFSLFKAGQEVQGDPRSQDLRLDRRLHRALAQDRQHQERLRRRRARAAPPEPDVRPALGQGLRLPDRRRCWRRPILFEKYLLGVLQLINKRGGGAFSPQGRGGRRGARARSSASPSTTSTAPRAPTSPPSTARSSTRASSRRRTSRTAISARARQPARRGEDPDRGLQASRRRRSARRSASSTTARFWEPHGRDRSPRTSRQRVTADFLKKNMCAPDREAARARCCVAVEDPYDLTRLDAIKAMNLAPRYEFVVGLRDDILDYIARELRRGRAPVRRGGRTSAASSTSSARGEEGEVEGEASSDGAARGRRDRQRHRQARATRSSSTPTTRAPPTSTSSPTARRRPRIVRLPHRRRLPEVPSRSRPPHRNAARAAPQDHGQARHLREAQAPGRQDPLQGPDGHDRAARRHHPHRRAATRTWSCASWPPRKPLPLEKMGFSERNLARVQDDPAEALRHLPGGGPHRLGQDHDAALGASASSTPWT